MYLAVVKDQITFRVIYVDEAVFFLLIRKKSSGEASLVDAFANESRPTTVSE